MDLEKSVISEFCLVSLCSLVYTLLPQLAASLLTPHVYVFAWGNFEKKKKILLMLGNLSFKVCRAWFPAFILMAEKSSVI